jgi:hypothetical protein
MSAIQSQVEREDLRRRVLSRDRLDLLRKYEQAQLLSIRLVPQSSLEALGRMGAETYEFSPSEELRNAADSSENESASLKIPLATITIEEIVSDTAYSAPHLSQSEKYRLVLGRYRISPNAIQMRFDPSSRPEFFRFKALMRYDAFAKRYAFVTADWGREDETIWRTNNIP